MPTISLSLPTTGPPPEAETAKAESETEGREGSTWTRLFQSYIQENKESTNASPKTTGKIDCEKSKSTDAVPLSTTPTTPVVPVPLIPPAAVAVAAVPVIASGPIVTGSPSKAPTVNNLATSPVSPVTGHAVAATPAMTVVSAPAQPTAVSSVSREPAVPTSAPAIQSQVHTGKPTTSVSAPSTAPTLIVPTTVQGVTSSTSPAAPPAIAAVPAQPAQLTSAQQFAIPIGLPSQAQPALQNAETSPLTRGGSSSPGQPKNPVGLATKAEMERSFVLGDNADSASAVISGKAGDDSADGGFDTNGSSVGGDKSAKADGQTPGDTSFTGVMSQLSPAAATSAAAANAALVQSSSHDERMAVINQISSHIQSMQPATSDPNTMTVTIQPPHWGDVKIAVTLDPESAGVTSSNISATVTASTTEVQGALQQHVQDLKDSLSNIGLHLDKLDVGVGTVTAASQSGSSSGHHPGQQSGEGRSSQDFLSNWSGGSTNSGGSGSQFQSASSWDGTADDGGVSAVPTNPAPSAATSQSASPTQNAANGRIDMRA